MDLIERYPGSSTLKFLKTFERFIDIPRTEKERLEAWGVFSNEPTTATTSEASAVEPPVSPVETTVQKTNTVISPAVVPPVAPKLPPLPPLIPPGLIAPTPAKKGRLSALLSRTGGRPSSSTTNTPTSRGNSLAHSGSPRSFKGSSNSALQDEPSCPTSEKKRRARSSSFNDAAAIAAGDSGKKPAGSPDLAASFSRSESGNRRPADLIGESALVSARRSTSLLSSLSFDDGEASGHNGTRSRNNKGSVILTCESSSSTVSRPEEVKGVVSSSPPTVVAAPSGGWRVPSDITWPTAHDKGALPPSDFRNERFKLIPSITIGPWIVKAAVGSTPALLGRKVVQRYFRGEDYLEIDIHVGSSVIASQVQWCNADVSWCNADSVEYYRFTCFLVAYWIVLTIYHRWSDCAVDTPRIL
jgi:Protein ENHANCED DISEASE RESISTANCE 2, C-terminal